MHALHPHRLTRLPLAACILAGVALVALPRPARAQFGPDLRLTGPPFFVSQTARNHAWSVATDDVGNVHVVYFDTRNGALGDVPPFYRRYDLASGVWGPELRLPDFPMANARYVAIAADCGGQVHVAWVNTVAGDSHYLYYKKRDAAGAWGPDVMVQARATENWDVRDPSIAADHLEDVYVVWAEGLENAQGDPVYNILYQVFDQSSTTWSGPQVITNYVAWIDPAPGALAPSVAAHHRLSGSGSIAHVAWADYAAGEVRYRDIRHLPPGTTTLRGTVSLPLGGGVAPPTVATRCGDVHVAWADPGAGTVIHRQGEMTFTAAETTAFATAVATGLGGQSPSIAVDGLGNLELVMLSGGAVVESHRGFMTGAWSASVPVSDPHAVPSDPSVAIDTRGAVHVVWTDYRTVPPGSGGAYYDVGGCLAGPAPAMAGDASPATVNHARSRTVLAPELAAAMAAAQPGERIPVLIGLRERPDAGALKRSVAGLAGAERRRQVVRTLRAAAGRAQARVLAELAGARQDGLASEVHSLWSANAVAAQVAPAALGRLAGLEEVETILFDPPRPMLEADDVVPTRTVVSRATVLPATPAWSVEWIGAPTVWGQGYRGACVLVAIIDTGVDWNHADLASRIWVNADETPGNSIDDDGNGVVDDVHGYDAANSDGSPLDDNGHGTHVGGSVAGDGTGGTITGVAPEARLMAVKVLGANGSGTFAGVMAGVEYAVENGAQVLNLSLGGLCTEVATRALLRANADAVAAAGVTMCVASANDRCKQRPPNLVRSPGDVPPPWLSPDQPPIGALGGVTTVGATGFMSDQVTYFSSPGPVDWSQPAGFGDWRICDPGTPNVGLIKPDVSAPGQDVLSTILGGGYGLNSGTSMATPHVAGLAALILSKNPQLTSDQVDQILETTALDLGPAGKDNDYGAGRIRAPEALAATPASAGQPMQVFSHVILDTIPPADGDGRLEAGETADLKLTLLNGGPFLLGDVVGLLQDDSPHVTISDAVAAFGDIPPTELRDNAANLCRLVVTPGAPDHSPVTFSLVVSAYGACGVVTFTDTLYHPVVAVEPGERGRWPAVALSEVSPNPAGFAATLEFAIGTAGPVRLAVYDVRGRRVRTLVDQARPAGVQRASWDGRDQRGARVAAGIYLARLETAGLKAQRKFVWLGR